MTEKFPGQEHLFDDDDDWGTSTPVKPKYAIVGGADPDRMISLVTRIADLRLMPTARNKVPLFAGWNGKPFWEAIKDIKAQIATWTRDCGRPNYAFCLGPHCGRGGDLVIEPDNQAGADWCRDHLPATLIANVTRHGFFHLHFKPDAPDAETGFYRGNYTDLFGSKKRHTQMAIEKGFAVLIDPKLRNDPEHLAHVAGERERALAAIPMGPIIDIKCTGGQAMAPGSVHETGHVYAEREPWTQEGWDARPTFDAKWFPQEVWVERQRLQLLATDKRDDDRVDEWWTRERKMRAALAHVRKVPPKSTGDNSSATLMRLCTVLVRGFVLDPPDARELATYWARDICGHEPWTRKEIEHKLSNAHDRGTLAWGAKLQDRSRNPDARLEAAEAQVADMIAGRTQRAPVAVDHVHDLDLIELPEGFVDEPLGREPDDVIAPLGYGPPGDDLVARAGVLVRETDVEAEVIDIAHARLARNQETGDHGASPDEPEAVDDAVFGDDEDIIMSPPTGKLVGSAPAPLAGSQDQLRTVFAQYGIDLNDIRKGNELYHTKTDKDGNIIALDTTTNNVALIFTYSRAYKHQFRMNTMSEEQEFAGVPFADSTDVMLKKNMDGLFGREVAKERVRDAAHIACLASRYNPVREFLDALPAWDGVERLDLLAEKVLFVKDNPKHSAILIRKWLLAAVARALQPGCQAENMLVLQTTKHGMHKTKFAKVLFGTQFFSNQLLNIHDRDARMVMARYWVMEIGEGEILSTPSKVMAFKAFLSQSDDDIRLPYGRRVMRIARRGVFIATTNEFRYLHDPTGSRRFWCITPGSRIDLDKLSEWREQLWAEALFKVRGHMGAAKDTPEWLAGQWWLTDDEQDENDRHNATRQNEDAWEGDVMDFLAKQGRNPFTIGDVLKSLGVHTNQRDWISTRRATELLRIAGCTPYKDGRVTTVGKGDEARRGRFWDPPATMPGDLDHDT